MCATYLPNPVGTGLSLRGAAKHSQGYWCPCQWRRSCPCNTSLHNTRHCCAAVERVYLCLLCRSQRSTTPVLWQALRSRMLRHVNVAAVSACCADMRSPRLPPPQGVPTPAQRE